MRFQAQAKRNSSERHDRALKLANEFLSFKVTQQQKQQVRPQRFSISI